MFSHGHYYFPGAILALKKKRGLREEGICFLQSEEFRVLDSVNTHSCAISGGKLEPLPPLDWHKLQYVKHIYGHIVFYAC